MILSRSACAIAVSFCARVVSPSFCAFVVSIVWRRVCSASWIMASALILAIMGLPSAEMTPLSSLTSRMLRIVTSIPRLCSSMAASDWIFALNWSRSDRIVSMLIWPTTTRRWPSMTLRTFVWMSSIELRPKFSAARFSRFSSLLILHVAMARMLIGMRSLFGAFSRSSSSWKARRSSSYASLITGQTITAPPVSARKSPPP